MYPYFAWYANIVSRILVGSHGGNSTRYSVRKRTFCDTTWKGSNLKISKSAFRVGLRLAACLLVILSTAAASVDLVPVDVQWLPISNAERAMSAPVVEKGAGVEAIFWRVHILDQVEGEDILRTVYHYVRLKIFDQAGKEKSSTFEIPYADKEFITAISGRTTKPDGSIVELSKDAIHDSVVVKAYGRKQNVKSFAMPGVEVGSIVEYRWREIHSEFNSRYIRLQFQRDVPVQRVSYYLRPLTRDRTSYSMSMVPFNCKPSAMKLETDNFNSMYVDNVPAFHEEPMMPGEGTVRQWLLVFYHQDGDKRDPEKYWNAIGKKTYGGLKQSLKSNGEMKEAAAKAVADSKDENDKVVHLIRYIHGNIRNLWDHDVSDAERAELIKKRPKDRYRTSAEVFKSGIGDADELNTLFAAMAAEAGLEARPAMLPNREDVVFDESFAEEYFLRSIDMAVQIGGKWKLFDVSQRRLPPGMLIWQEEGQRALITDPKKPFFITASPAPPESSAALRKARLALSDDGTLEGDLEESWTGHSAFQKRIDLVEESEARRIELSKNDIMKTYPQAELTAVKLENCADAEKPLKLTYHVKIPGYAQRTGKRLFLQPYFFERGNTPLFSSNERKYDVYFHNAWSESDDVVIDLPRGFDLEKAENPGSMSLGATGGYTLNMGTTKQHQLVCGRSLRFGSEGNLAFGRVNYTKLKDVFDEIDRRDKNTVALKQAVTAGTQ